MTYLSVTNWERYQHYRDRKPVWIKVYVELLDDEAYRLTDKQFGQLVKFWLLAGRTDNKIPDDPVILEHMMGTPAAEIDVELFLERRYLRRTKSSRRKTEKWPSRYIPKKLREEVLERDEYRCVQCGATLWLEIDHVIPVSCGGPGTLGNLQTLCRSCNRAKRAKVAAELRSSLSSDRRSVEVRSKNKKEEGAASGPPAYAGGRTALRVVGAVCPECEMGGTLHTADCSRRAAG